MDSYFNDYKCINMRESEMYSKNTFLVIWPRLCLNDDDRSHSEDI